MPIGDEIKNANKCPFCNSKDLRYFHASENRFAVMCNDCGALGPNSKYEDIAVLFWNTVIRNDEFKKLEKEANWLAQHMQCDNTFTPEQEAKCIAENGPCWKCLREAARRNTECQN